MLLVLAEADLYGYAILKRIADLSEGELSWTDGMLYPLLHRLERAGAIQSEWRTPDSGRRRKYYRLTESGQAALADQRSQWTVVATALDTLWQQASIGPAGHLAPGQS